MAAEQSGTATWLGDSGEYHVAGHVFAKDVTVPVSGKLLAKVKTIGGFKVHIDEPKAAPEPKKVAAPAPEGSAPAAGGTTVTPSVGGKQTKA